MSDESSAALGVVLVALMIVGAAVVWNVSMYYLFTYLNF